MSVKKYVYLDNGKHKAVDEDHSLLAGLSWVEADDTFTGDTSANTGYIINATGGVVTLPLPLSPTVGDIVGFNDAFSKASTNTIIVGRNGELIQEAAEDLVIDIDGAAGYCIFVGGLVGWDVVLEASDGAGVQVSGGGHEIQDNSSPVTPRPALNFIGAIVTDNLSNDSTDISGFLGVYNFNLLDTNENQWTYTPDLADGHLIATFLAAEFVGVDFGGITDFTLMWNGRSDLVSFPLLDTSNGTLFTSTWMGCWALTSLPLLNVSSGTDFTAAWRNCTGLTSFPLIDVSSGTIFSQAWTTCSSLTSFPLLNVSSGTDFTLAWLACWSLTSFPLLDVSNGTLFSSAWDSCIGLTSFPLLDVSQGTGFNGAWKNCSGLTSFPLLDISQGTGFIETWFGCRGLTSFPLLDVSNGTLFSSAWDSCSGLTSFPVLDLSQCTSFDSTWFACTALASFPLLNMTAGTRFSYTWFGCGSLVTFPPNFFNNVQAINYSHAWEDCALDQTSVDNILVSISVSAEANNLSNGTLNMDGGTSSTPSATGLAAAAILTDRGWTVTHN